MASSEMTEHVVQLYRSIYAVVRRIPTGQVATYGQVAELAGIPGGARVAGAAMKVSKPGQRLPWQRVIGKAGRTRGRIAIHDPVGAAVQRQLLEREGVIVGDSGLIALDRYGWLPAQQSPYYIRSPSPRSAREALAYPEKTARVRSPRGGSGRAASLRRRPRSGSKRRASSSRR
jgi:methylated-DNA-protein-cysteine methyltransferase-like protein